MLRRYFSPFALALLFALGQQGAVLHELSHAADYSVTQLNGYALDVQASKLSPQAQQPAAFNTGLSNTGQHKQAPHSQLCDKCLGYAQIAGAVASNTIATPMLAIGFSAIVFHSSTHLSPASLAYSARAPPLTV